MDQKLVTEALNRHTQPLVLICYSFDYVDPSDYIDLFITGGRQAWSYASCDQTVKAADSSFDSATRTKLYEKAQQILADRVPASFLFVPVYNSLWNPKV